MQCTTTFCPDIGTLQARASSLDNRQQSRCEGRKLHRSSTKRPKVSFFGARLGDERGGKGLWPSFELMAGCLSKQLVARVSQRRQFPRRLDDRGASLRKNFQLILSITSLIDWSAQLCIASHVHAIFLAFILNTRFFIFACFRIRTNRNVLRA